MSDSLKLREKLALLLMSDSDDARRLIIFLVYKTIAKNGGITTNQLSHLLRQKYALPKNRIDSALSILTSSDLFDAVSVFTPKPNVVHLRCKNSSMIEEWLSDFCLRIPETCGYDAPTFEKQGVH